LVAEKMDKTDVASVELPIKTWQRLTGFYPKKLQRLLNVLQKFDQCSVNVTGKYIKVDVPKLLKIRDEYSKKSRQTPSQETETDKDKEIDDVVSARDPFQNNTQDVSSASCESMTDFARMSSTLQKTINAGIPLNTSRLHAWIAGGCDFELDILPTVTRIMAGRSDPPSSLNYFERAIITAKNERLRPVQNDPQTKTCGIPNPIAEPKTQQEIKEECDAQMQRMIARFQQQQQGVAHYA
jgi:hypothetical protein